MKTASLCSWRFFAQSPSNGSEGPNVARSRRGVLDVLVAAPCDFLLHLLPLLGGELFIVFPVFFFASASISPPAMLFTPVASDMPFSSFTAHQRDNRLAPSTFLRDDLALCLSLV